VLANGERVNPTKQTQLFTPAGPTLLSCYADDAVTRWTPGSQVTVTVTLADGSQQTLPVVMPPASQAGQTAVRR
jgi:hypothetical protein